MDSSVFEDGASSDFEPAAKKAKAPSRAKASAKPKAAPKKPAQPKAKATASKAAPKKRKKADSEDEENSEQDDTLNVPDQDDTLLSKSPPSAKKQKKAPAPKKSSGKPLADIANESFGMDGAADPKPSKGKDNATDRYQKLTQLEHIIKRPDTYIGSVERTETEMWVFNSTTESMEMRKIQYTPGLYKIFDEILVNAADNKQNDKNMDTIKVTINREDGEISIRNNGRGIPIEIHAKEGIYIPEMIFGHLLTSSNYDDNEAKVTGGRNGYGAKLCNVYSTEFTIETADSRSGQKYKQTWTSNMSKMGKAKITSHKSDDYTQVTFKPDYAKFNMEGIDDDFEALVKRRVYDLAGTLKGVKVWLNGDRIKVNSFKKYMEMYTKAIKKEQIEGGTTSESAAVEKQVILTDNPNERWEVGFAVSDGSFQQVSFVNSIATTSGGTHVNYIADQICDKLEQIVKKRKAAVTMKGSQIRNHIFLFVNCSIVNPSFNSQTKEQMTSKRTAFGSKCDLSDNFLKAISKTEVVENILHFAQKKADKVLAKSDGNRRSRMNNSKLTDANKAGTKDGHLCTLILTEGDSASLLALAGRAVVNPDLFGVFPLRGKVLNVRDATVDQISKNAEIQNIKKFMGLQHKKEYTDTKTLRYGHLMIMTDQDHDGSHIKGLLINFLQCQFPSLLKLDGFLMEFITPIVKVWKGDPKHPKQLKSFFTMPEYEEWKEEPGHQKGWEHKYYKGLGTSSPDDAQIYFGDLDRHLKEFHTMKAEEEKMIDLAFSKKQADARKEWLGNFQPGTYLDMSAPKISYDDFVNKELILFSMADNLRSIPSVIDGFKPGQRKVLYTCFRRNLKKDQKVVELAGSVSGLTNYAYGDVSLQDTIVGLAQNFVGSNNINCLEPSGNFGSRLQGGKDCASARYIYTRLSPFARRIFNASDEPLLTYNEDDGKTIEPHMYVPILPMVLVNGAHGIGTGWSTSIPNYNPEEIVANLKRRIAGSKEDMLSMKPWYKGWTGETEEIGNERFKFTGTIRQTGENEVEITELPVQYWTQDFKDKLEDILKAEKAPSWIKDYLEYNTPDKINFIIKLDDKQMAIAVETGLIDKFGLSKTQATTNLVAFDAQGRIHKYDSVLDIMEEFYHVRLKYYQKRKEYLLAEMQRELEKMTNQARFITMIVEDKLKVSKKKKAVLITELKKLGFRAFPKVVDARKESETEPVVQEDAEEDADEDLESRASDYDYLLGMAIWSLTMERVEKLQRQIGDKEEEIDTLIKKSAKDLWTEDLDAFLAEWFQSLEDDKARSKKLKGMNRRGSQKLGIGAKGSKKRKKGESDDESDDDFVVKKKPAASKGPKPNSLLSFLNKPTSTTAPAKPAAIAKSTVAGKGAGSLSTAGTMADALPVVDIDMEDDVEEKASSKLAKKPAARIAAAKSNPTKILSDDEDTDAFLSVAKEEEQDSEPAKKPASRTARTAAAKKKYTFNDSDDEDGNDSGDDMLGDISAMVKPLGGLSGSEKPMFSTTRPGSSNGLSKKLPRASTVEKITELDDDADETDYKMLVPQDSPQRKAAKSAADTIMADADEDDSLLDIKRPISKPIPKPTAKAAAKPAPKPKAKEEKKPVEKKKLPPSPAAKAYAAKLAKEKEAASKSKSKTLALKKKVLLSDDEDDVEDATEDADKVANDILSDDEGESEVVKPTASRRPGRAAATKKKAYHISDDDEDEEDSFQIDDDSE